MPGEPNSVPYVNPGSGGPRQGADSRGVVPAGGVDWAACLPSAAAPGFVYLAAACGGVAVGGGGTTRQEAAVRLMGEMAEVVGTAAAPVLSDLDGDPALDAQFTDEGGPVRRIAALNLTAGTPLGLAAAAAYPAEARRADAPPTSLGLAAGPDTAAARLSGLMEVIERDAAARWWNGGARARMLVPEPALLARLAALRAGASVARTTAFLLLPSPTGVPVACALSRDADGAGLACGLKAAPDRATAADGALIELCQMEIALDIARLRAANGRATAADAGVLARAALTVDGFAAFAALLPDAEAAGPGDLDGLVARLMALGLCVIAADLPVAEGALAKMVVPGLWPLPGPGAPRPGTPGAVAPLM